MKIDQIKFSCKDGDVVRCQIAGRDQFFRIKNNQLLTMEGKHPCFTLDHLSAVYEIVDPEQKVLCESELFGKIMTLNENGCHTAFNRQWLSDVIELCHQNGRLERDIELRPFVEYVKGLYRSLELEGFKKEAENVLQHINNIPSLNDDRLKRESERA